MKRSWIFGLIVSVIGVVLIVLFLLIPAARPFDKVHLPDEAQVLIEGGIPEIVVKSYAARQVQELWPDIEYAVIAEASELKIFFDKREALGGKWRGKEPSLIILKSDRSDQFSGNCFGASSIVGEAQDEEWKKISADPSDVRPEFSVNLPDPNPDCMHTLVKTAARMIFVSPKHSGQGASYYNIQEELVREVNFFIVSKEELNSLQEIFPNMRIELGVRLGFMGIVLAFMIYFLYKIFES